MAGTRGFVFFLAGAGEMLASKEGCWDDGHILLGGVWFSFGAVPNSIGQCRVGLIASRFGFGAQKGTNCRMGR